MDDIQKNAKFELYNAATLHFWTDHRPKTLPDFGVARELAEWKGSFIDKNQTIEGAIVFNLKKTVLSRLEQAMEKMRKACVSGIHDNTRTYLAGAIAAVKAEVARVSKQAQDLEALLTEAAKAVGPHVKELDAVFAKHHAQVARVLGDCDAFIARCKKEAEGAKRVNAGKPLVSAQKMAVLKKLLGLLTHDIGEIVGDYANLAKDSTPAVKAARAKFAKVFTGDIHDDERAGIVAKFQHFEATIAKMRDWVLQLHDKEKAVDKTWTDLVAGASGEEPEITPKTTIHAPGRKANTLNLGPQAKPAAAAPAAGKAKPPVPSRAAKPKLAPRPAATAKPAVPSRAAKPRLVPRKGQN